MSRARPFQIDDENIIWMDVKAPAKVEHLEVLADVEGLDLDDLLDELFDEKGHANLTQKEVLFRLHTARNLIPKNIIQRREERLRRAKEEPACRICSLHGWECEGRITRHHFIPRWLMRELEKYNAYAARSKCTIPICVGRHRDLHYRDSELDKSIVPYLYKEEKTLAEKMLRELKEERPIVFELINSGSTASYEYVLVENYLKGRFRAI